VEREGGGGRRQQGEDADECPDQSETRSERFVRRIERAPAVGLHGPPEHVDAAGGEQGGAERDARAGEAHASF
jgi:hypothetical protein